MVTPEHHGIPDGYNPAPLVTLAALARETKRIRLATGCHLMPLHHPLFVAEEPAMVDILSNGRLILGCAISNVEGEFKRLGLDKRQQASRFDEGLEVLRRAWTEDEFSFFGQHYNIVNARSTPKPLQKPHPPIWIGAQSEAGCKRAGRLGLPWFAGEYNLNALKKFAEIYRTTTSNRGKSGQTQIILWRIGWVSENQKEEEKIEKEWWPHAQSNYWFYSSAFPGRGLGDLESQNLYQSWWNDVKNEEDIKYEKVKGNGDILVGTCDQVIGEIERYERELGSDYIIFQIVFGSGPPLPRVLDEIRLFGRKIVPYFNEREGKN